MKEKLGTKIFISHLGKSTKQKNEFEYREIIHFLNLNEYINFNAHTVEFIKTIA